MSKVWHDQSDSLLCAVTAPMGLAAFNVGGVTIHRLLQLPIEHEGRTAGYWKLGKDTIKVMRRSLSNLRLLIIDEVSMLSNLNLAYVHLRLEEIFGHDQWFGGVNMLFVGDILQLPPVNGAPVFDRITNKSVALKLGCMTSVNIWQDTVLYDELTINERQKKDRAFSSMLDEVHRGCPTNETLQLLQERVMKAPVVDTFEQLLAAKQSPLCLFPTRKACQEFNSQMLQKLDAEIKQIPCVDEVDETASGTFKWNKKATQEMKRLNSDCNLTAGLEAVLEIAVGARVMLHRNIDTSQGLVNGAVGTVISIKAHHIEVQFDNVPQPYQVEKVKSKFVILKNVYIFRKQFPLILAFAVTIHKCQGLSLDCAMMKLSSEVFSPGMVYVALSRVKEMKNLHLIAFDAKSVMVSSKCLQEINRLRQTYRPDLPLYTVPSIQSSLKKNTRAKLTAALLSDPPPPKQSDAVSAGKRKKADKSQDLPPSKKKRAHVDVHVVSAVSSGKKRKAIVTEDDGNLPTVKKRRPRRRRADTRPPVQSWYRYNPVSVDWQRWASQQLELHFVCDNRTTPGGPDVRLNHPASMRRVSGDGNCLFCALCYIITGSDGQHLLLRRRIIEHMRSNELCMRLLANHIEHEFVTIDEYIEGSRMDRDGSWGTTAEVITLAHMLGVNIVSYNSDQLQYQVYSPGIIDFDAYEEDNSRPSMYIMFVNGNHFNVMMSQE